MTIYIKANQLGNVKSTKVEVKDIADVYCNDEIMLRTIKRIKVYEFPIKSTHKTFRQVISILDVVKRIKERYPNHEVVTIGETETLVAYDTSEATPTWLEKIKIIVVCILVFFGAAFTIMAFNNDISIQGVFEQFYLQMTGENKPAVSELEIAYSIGMALGIIFFFNHIGKKRLTNDMTPIEVEFDKHKKDICQAMIDNAQGKGEK